jgi:putative ABC transport system ATP-binding protein
MLKLNHISKQYQRYGSAVTALQATTLDIADGEYVAIVGPSGSGKTTLLSILGGMLAPSTGKMQLGTESLYDLSVSARTRLRGAKIGFIFQTFNLIPYLTALENVQMPLCLGGVPKEQQVERARQTLERVGLGDRMQHLPSELSVGQQQRVALARTLAINPALILADEPTGNLDPETREQVLAMFDEIHREGRTLIVVTHDPACAARAQRTLRLVNGALQPAPAGNVVRCVA